MSLQTLRIEYSEPPAFSALSKPKRYKIFFGGRGAAKSWQVAQSLILKGIEGPIRVLCTREFQASIRESVHKLLVDTIDRLEVASLYTVEQSTIRGVSGSQFIFEGLRNNTTKIKSMEGVTHCWCEEAEAITDPNWGLLIPTIRENNSEIWVTFNPAHETDATYKRFVEPYTRHIDDYGYYEDDTVYVSKVSWRDNPWFPETLRLEMERLKATDHAKYLHIWEGECKSAVDGAIYGEQLRKVKEDNRFCSIPIETGVSVNTFWDLGRNDHGAIWFHQRVGKEDRFIDYYESRLVGLDHYARVLREKDYLYGEHFLPHDVEVVELGSNTSRRETLEGMGVKPVVVVPRVSSLEDGIDITRQAFARCWFDKNRCADGIAALQNYQYIWDEQFQTFRRSPLHNWASNGADAFRQYAQGYVEPVNYDYSRTQLYPNLGL